jgi:hypothetical protein
MDMDFDSWRALNPWGERSAIYHALEAGNTLPDDTPEDDEFSYGELDTWFSAQETDLEPFVIPRLHDAVIALTVTPNEQNAQELYELLLTYRAIHVIDKLSTTIAANRHTSGLVPANFYWAAQWLCTCAPDREPVKYGLRFIGIAGGRVEDYRVLLHIGEHREFLRFAWDALVNRAAEDSVFNELRSRARARLK